MDKMREEFDKWCANHKHAYAGNIGEWWSWQAATNARQREIDVVQQDLDIAHILIQQKDAEIERLTWRFDVLEELATPLSETGKERSILRDMELRELAELRAYKKACENQEPFVYLRMADGAPDWSEDCFSENRESLMEYHDSEPPMNLYTHPAPVPEWVRLDVDAIMEQAQAFASSWALVGGRLDDGNGIDNANAMKEELRQMLLAASKEGEEPK